MTTHEHNSQPFFVTILAGAISSVGYGVSVFAIGILWLLPSAAPALPVQALAQVPIKSKRKLIESRRRSAPSALPSNGAQKSPITSLNSSSSQSSPDTPRTPSSRRVYFADSPTVETPPFRKRPLVPDDLREDCCESFPGLTSVIPLDASPRSSSSTLVHICPTCTISRVPDVVLEPDSESSRTNNRPLLPMTPRLPNRIKDTWTRKVSGSKPNNQVATDSGGEATYSDELSCSASVAGPSTSSQRSKRRTASLSFAWPISKSKALPEVVVASTSTSSSPKPSLSTLPTSDISCSKPTSPCPTSAISSLVRSTKHQRRASAPIRERTQPYSYPYFASPPTAGNQRPSSAGAASEVGSSGTSLERNTTSKSLDLDRESTDLQRRRKNAAAQAVLGLGPRPPQQRRATYEGLASAA